VEGRQNGSNTADEVASLTTSLEQAGISIAFARRGMTPRRKRGMQGSDGKSKRNSVTSNVRIVNRDTGGKTWAAAAMSAQKGPALDESPRKKKANRGKLPRDGKKKTAPVQSAVHRSKGGSTQPRREKGNFSWNDGAARRSAKKEGILRRQKKSRVPRDKNRMRLRKIKKNPGRTCNQE